MRNSFQLLATSFQSASHLWLCSKASQAGVDLSISAFRLATISSLYFGMRTHLSLVICFIVTWYPLSEVYIKRRAIHMSSTLVLSPTSASPLRQFTSKSDTWSSLPLSFLFRFFSQQRWACRLLSEMSSPPASRIHMREQFGRLANRSW